MGPLQHSAKATTCSAHQQAYRGNARVSGSHRIASARPPSHMPLGRCHWHCRQRARRLTRHRLLRLVVQPCSRAARHATAHQAPIGGRIAQISQQLMLKSAWGHSVQRSGISAEKFDFKTTWLCRSLGEDRSMMRHQWQRSLRQTTLARCKLEIRTFEERLATCSTYEHNMWTPTGAADGWSLCAGTPGLWSRRARRAPQRQRRRICACDENGAPMLRGNAEAGAAQGRRPLSLAAAALREKAVCLDSCRFRAIKRLWASCTGAVHAAACICRTALQQSLLWKFSCLCSELGCVGGTCVAGRTRR